jgi:DNA-binding NtrC family response regulator
MTQKILVLDNSPEYRQLLEQVVVGMGYKACVTDRATEAWKILQTDPHDLILMDVKMPAVQGDQFLKYIRKMGFDGPVIAISGYLTPKVIEQLRKYRVSKMAKPFTIRRLAAEIHETIGEPDG